VHQTKGLCESILERIQGTDFVSLAVDDMMYFRKASFAEAMRLLKSELDICLWSWRIGANMVPNAEAGLTLCDGHWVVPWATAMMPYSYIFHTDGSLFRANDLEYWISLLPQPERAWNLNHIEGYLAALTQRARQGSAAPLLLRGLHAGPLEQTCITWAINKVSDFGSAAFCETGHTGLNQLRAAFESGARLDYSGLYGLADWLSECGGGISTHVPATKEAAELFRTLVRWPNAG